jgi:hypothetical protein
MAEEQGTPMTEQPAGDAPVEQAPPPADPLAGGADALLSVFAETKVEGEDKGALLELAGDVPIDALLEDLRTLQSAIRLRLAEAAATA